MGIPSYFRRILQRWPACLRRNVPSGVEALCFDFNCLIYRCLKAPSMPAWSEDSNEAFESALLEEVNRTVQEIWVFSGRPAKVLLAVDGVVPMAKIRQQRVRRFKSAWLTATVSSAEPTWDKNAITPGSAFMDKLTQSLTVLVGRHKGWELSSVREPGEGEHKVMRWLRANPCNACVYGLDADLILLTMIAAAQTGKQLCLLREKQEFGGKPVGGVAEGPQEYQVLDMTEFQKKLRVEGLESTLNYVALMSLMGNDFLPHGLTHSLTDDGHEYVLEEMKRGTRLVGEGGLLNVEALRDLMRRWSADEPQRLLATIRKKQEQAERGVGKGMDVSEGLPLQWMVERAILAGGQLAAGWRDTYWEFVHTGASNDPETRQRLCAEFFKGCQWILDYYIGGRLVDMGWMFPAWVPPLWSELTTAALPGGAEAGAGSPPTPEEQLAMVLPLASWGLIRDRKHRALPARLPQLWPTGFSFVSVGRKWLWQCEALVPVLTAERLRANLDNAC